MRQLRSAPATLSRPARASASLSAPRVQHAAGAQQRRRLLLLVGGGGGAALLLPATSVFAAEPHTPPPASHPRPSGGPPEAPEPLRSYSELEPLFSASQLFYPPPSFGYRRVLLYPSWLRGEWRATSTLTAVSTPTGRRLVPPRLLAAADAEAAGLAPGAAAPPTPTPFAVRFYATLPDSAANGARVALGLLPVPAVAADRAFNLRSLAEAQRQAGPGSPAAAAAVSSVAYDPRASPDVVDVTYASGARTRLLLSALRSDDPAGAEATEGTAGAVFRTAECSRTAPLLAAGRGGGGATAVRDFLTLSRFERVGPHGAALRQRVAVFLTPNDAAYFDAANRAVVVFDYAVRLDRVLTPVPVEEGGSAGEPMVCVDTPKGVTQCA